MFVILLLYLTGAHCQGPSDDVYVLNFDSPVYECDDEESKAFVNTSDVEVQRYNETTAYMTGTINFRKGMDSDTMVEIVVYKKDSGRNEMIITHEICKLCNEIGNAESMYNKNLKYFGFPDNCPFEAGSYPVRDFVATDTGLPINAANFGRYQVIIKFHKNPDGACRDKTFLACLKLDFMIEPI